jgi:hypothetical protein
VVSSLRALAEGGHAILCTIHSPSAAVLDRFHKVLLLSHGHVLFFGSIPATISHLQGMGYKNHFDNPAEYFIDCCIEFSPAPAPPSDLPVIKNEGLEVSYDLSTFLLWLKNTWTMMYLLTHRDFLTHRRMSTFWMISYVRAAIVGVIIGISITPLSLSLANTPSSSPCRSRILPH